MYLSATIHNEMRHASNFMSVYVETETHSPTIQTVEVSRSSPPREICLPSHSHTRDITR